MSSLAESSNLLIDKRVAIGSRSGFLYDLKDTIDRMKFNMEDESAILQQADITQLAIDISRREVLYQMSLSIAAKVMSISLLDFIT